MKNFCSMKIFVKRMNRQMRAWDEILANDSNTFLKAGIIFVSLSHTSSKKAPKNK